MQIDGRCHCGNITFTAEADPNDVLICHCSDCQSLSGSAFRTVVLVASETFVLEGDPKTYVKTAASGRDRIQTFCPTCGSPLYSCYPGDEPQMLGIRLGTVRQRDRLPPKAEYWTCSAQDWAEGISGSENSYSQDG